MSKGDLDTALIGNGIMILIMGFGGGICGGLTIGGLLLTLQAIIKQNDNEIGCGGWSIAGVKNSIGIRK